MIKSDLRENGLTFEYKEPKETLISIIWIGLTLSFMAMSFFGVLELSKNISLTDSVDPLIYISSFLFGTFGIFAPVIYLLLVLFLYFALKVVLTILVCKEKRKSISLKMLKIKSITSMPICFCKEALKVWQIVLSYLAPIVLMYSGLFFLSVVGNKINWIYVPMLVLLSFVMAFDLTLVLYVLFYKIKYGMDYISVDNHVYLMTLFSNSHIEKN